MRLISMTLRGFKSFASTTVFNFNDGINAIIGPNGSGKSNVVDALLWVLGEQGSKNLRGSAMQDVIFAGTTHKSPLGRAKVTLVLDNSEHELPLPHSTVEISRTLFRGGGSEYEINGATVRLSDIQELFNTASIAKGEHSIIGQGHIDKVLQSSATERRALIEQATGILTYRRRAEKTERKLHAMKVDLNRLEDLNKELTNQLKPLGEQATNARTAYEIQAQIRELREKLLAHQAFTQHQEHTQHEELYQKTHTQHRKLTETLNTCHNKKTQHHTLRTELDQHRQEHYENLQELEKIMAAAQSLKALAQERSRATEKNNSLESYQQHLQRTEESIAHEKAEEQQLRQHCEELEHTLQELTQRYEQQHQKLEQCQEQIQQQQQRQKEHQEQLTRNITERASLRAKYERIRAEHQRYREELDNAQTQRQDYAQKLEQLTHTLQEHTKTLQDEEKQQQQLRVEREEYAHKSEQSRNLCTQRSITVHTLQASIASLEQLLQTHHESKPEHTGKPLHTLIHIKSGQERAIAHALGAYAQSYLYEKPTYNTAHNTIFTPSSPTPPTKNLKGLTPAIQYVTTENTTAQHVLQQALANIYLTEEFTTENQQLLEEHPHITIYDIRGRRYSNYSYNTAELEDNHLEIAARVTTLTQELKEAEILEEEAQKQHRAHTQKLTQLKEQEHELARRLGNTQKTIHRLETEQAQLTTQHQHEQEQYQYQQKKLARYRVEEQEHAQLLEQLNHNIAALQKQQPTDNPQQLEEQNTLKEELEHLTQERTIAQNSLSHTQRYLLLNREKRQELETHLNTLQKHTAQEQHHEQQRLLQQQRAHTVARCAQKLLEKLTQERNNQEQKYRAITEELKALTHTCQNVEDQLADITHQHQTLSNTLQKLTLTQAQSSIRYENLNQRIGEELGCTLEELIETHHDYLAHHAPETSELEKNLHQEQQRLKALGTVNPLALEEYQALDERQQYLHTQITDMKKSRAAMRSLIAELNRHMKTAFVEAFEQTKDAFERIFAELFPGGEGTLALTDDEDLLNCGIEIHARPADKKVQRLSLLSGGERALASLALVTAIFEARPAPFYVLDEVEAALDDRNLSRVLPVFERLGQKSQLLIITHKPRTMEIAQTLYGITMFQGISNVISQDAQAIRNALES
ncbi:chromosome segregation protein SMC [Rothia sp. P13129]|uniref:chromosome segregation protein SMC n=1 Tax=Rothia sp. P13129 TaxID=3402664 RepID=UPI003AD4C79B